MSGSLVVALVALVISATSLWLSALRPAKLELEHLQWSDEEGSALIGTGGQQNVPAISEVALRFALANFGSRAGLLLGIEVVEVRSYGSDFADGPAQGRGSSGHPEIQIDKGQAQFPRTVEAREVRSVNISFGIGGEFKTQLLTTHLEEPSRDPLSLQLSSLERVEVKVRCRYRRAGGLFLNKETSSICTLSIPGDSFKKRAITYWRGINRDRQALIVEGKSPEYSRADD